RVPFSRAGCPGRCSSYGGQRLYARALVSVGHRIRNHLHRVLYRGRSSVLCVVQTGKPEFFLTRGVLSPHCLPCCCPRLLVSNRVVGCFGRGVVPERI